MLPMTPAEQLQLAKRLFESIKDSGDYSPAALLILESCIPIVATHLTNLPARPGFSRVTSVAILADNSESLNTYPPEGEGEDERLLNYVALIRGINFNFDELRKSKVAKGLEGLVFLLNAERAYIKKVTGASADSFGWAPVADFKPLTPAGYLSDQGTPLYRRQAQMLATSVFRLEQWALEHSIDGQTVNLSITDGADTENSSPLEDDEDDPRFYAYDCATLSREMLATRKHQIHFWGLKLENTDFRSVAISMGVPPGNVGVIKQDGKALRASFQLFSQSTSASAASSGGSSGGSASFTRSALPQNVPPASTPPAIAEPKKDSDGLGFGDTEHTEPPTHSEPTVSSPATPSEASSEPPKKAEDLGFGGVN